MAYVEIEDDTGTMEALCFHRALDNGGGYLTDNAAVIVRGRISVRDEKAPQIVADSIRPISDAGTPEMPAEHRQRTLWLRLAREDARLLRRIELLQEMFPGRDRMIVYFADSKRKIGADCVIRESLLAELRALLGADNVKVV